MPEATGGNLRQLPELCQFGSDGYATARSWPALFPSPSPTITPTALLQTGFSKRAPSRSAVVWPCSPKASPPSHLATRFSTRPKASMRWSLPGWAWTGLPGPGLNYPRTCLMGRAGRWLERNRTVLLRYPASSPPSGPPFPNRALVNTAFSQPDSIVEAPDSRGIPSFSRSSRSIANWRLGTQ